MLSRIAAVVVVISALLCAVATADDHTGYTGIFTECWYNSNHNGNDSILCDVWSTTHQWVGCSSGWTPDQYWPPDYYFLRWGASNLSTPRIVLDTNRWYSFYAKSYVVGVGWRYSDWCLPYHYVSSNDEAAITLTLSRTTPPMPPGYVIE